MMPERSRAVSEYLILKDVWDRIAKLVVATYDRYRIVFHRCLCVGSAADNSRCSYDISTVVMALTEVRLVGWLP